MYQIVRRQQFGPKTFLWDVNAPDLARAARPGHFVLVRVDEHGERIPLTIADYDWWRGTITLVIQAVGKTTLEMMELGAGDYILDLIGPLGLASEIHEVCGTVVLVGGGLGVAPVYPQLREHKRLGNRTVSIIGFRNKEQVFWEDEFRKFSDELILTTDDGSYGRKGFVTAALKDVLETGQDVCEVVAIGPIPMMKACSETSRPFGVKTMVSLNAIMVDGTGMCGSCRVTVGGTMKFACVDGPDFDGHQVDFEELSRRQTRFQSEEKEALEQRGAKAGSKKEECQGTCAYINSVLADLPAPDPSIAVNKPKHIKSIARERVEMPHQPPAQRVHNFNEVALGLDLDAALAEAERCLRCKKAHWVEGCPVGVDIPAFIGALLQRNLREAYRILKDSNALPAACGRVCPQESQCEARCIVTKTLPSVAIGRLERFVADAARGRGWDEPAALPMATAGKRAAIDGSGPAGLACAGDLSRAGVGVTVFEALHVAGGVLRYGIPEFRLPDYIIDVEIANLQKAGVEVKLNTVIGKLFTLPQLMSEMGYDAVFIATGAGSPKFMGIPGEGLNGVYSANEFLTRVNLMRGYRHPEYDTPVGLRGRLAVIGAGNTAMDAARVALRMGAGEVSVIYRRSTRECPARKEELDHAIEEGVKFHWLTNPVSILGDEGGWVTGVRCQQMELGEPDASGRRSPVAVPGSEFNMPVETVVYALGTSANPIIAQTTPGLQTNRRGYIEVDEQSGMTSVPGIFAGGDIVTGAATVILAMGAGRRAARGMLEFMGLGTAQPGANPDPAGANPLCSA
jgi:homotetrameric NADPH-dependent glutamate synthase